MSQPRFSLFGPSTADKLLAEAYSLEIKLLRFPDDDGELENSLSVEVKSSLPADSEGAEIVANLIRSFRSGGESESVA